jgi:hypothetical protein
VPDAKEQFTTSVKDSITLSTTAVAEGAVTQQIVIGAKHVAVWITETKVYKTIEVWLDDVTDSLKTYYESAKTALSKIGAAAGTPPK